MGQKVHCKEINNSAKTEKVSQGPHDFTIMTEIL